MKARSLPSVVWRVRRPVVLIFANAALGYYEGYCNRGGESLWAAALQTQKMSVMVLDSKQRSQTYVHELRTEIKLKILTPLLGGKNQVKPKKAFFVDTTTLGTILTKNFTEFKLD